MRIQFLKAHEEFTVGQFAQIPDDSALTLIKARKAKKAEPYVPGKAKPAGVKIAEEPAPPAEKKKASKKEETGKVVHLPTAKSEKK